jgi:hypothetical protein
MIYSIEHVACICWQIDFSFGEMPFAHALVGLFGVLLLNWKCLLYIWYYPFILYTVWIYIFIFLNEMLSHAIQDGLQLYPGLDLNSWSFCSTFSVVRLQGYITKPFHSAGSFSLGGCLIGWNYLRQMVFLTCFVLVVCAFDSVSNDLLPKLCYVVLFFQENKII